MAVKPITIGGKTIGWRARVRVYPVVGGVPSTKLKGIERRFLASKGFRKSDADQWKRHQLHERHEIERQRIAGLLPRTNTGRISRTIEELVDLYYNDIKFVRLRPKSKKRIIGFMNDLLAWNKQYGRPYAELWTQELANQRLAYIWGKYRRKGPPIRAGYEKLIFTLETKRRPRAIEENPWPPIPQFETNRKTIAPLSFTDEQLAAILHCATPSMRQKDLDANPAIGMPYTRAIFEVLLYTGLRTGELEQLPVNRVAVLQGKPFDIVVEYREERQGMGGFNTKNNRDRIVRLNPAAAAAVAYLLDHRDTSGYLVRRDRCSPRCPFERQLARTKLRVFREYPHLEEQLSGTTERTRTTIHTFRKTFATRLAKHASLQTVADLLGDTPEVAANYYISIDNESMSEAVMRMDAIPVPEHVT